MMNEPLQKHNMLVIAHVEPANYIRTINNFIRELKKNGAFILSQHDLYQEYGYAGAQEFIGNYIENNNIGIILYIPSSFEFYFSVEFIERLRKTVYFVSLFPEIETSFEQKDLYYAQAIDLALSPNFIHRDLLKSYGVNAITYFGYYDVTQCYPIQGIQKDCDLSFVGQVQDKTGRKRLLSQLEKNGYAVKVFGSKAPNGELTHEDKIKLFNRTKINLNLAGVTEHTRLTRPGSMHQRLKQFKSHLFEVPLCKAFLLSEYIFGIEHIFEIGTEIDVFHDEDELIEKVRFYLDHAEIREKMAGKAYERLARDKDINVSTAVPRLIDIIRSLASRKKYHATPLFVSNSFLRNFATFRLKMFLVFLKRFQVKHAMGELLLFFKYHTVDVYQVRIFLIEEVLDLMPFIKHILKRILGERNDD